jgi:hypothetical protein
VPVPVRHAAPDASLPSDAVPLFLSDAAGSGRSVGYHTEESGDAEGAVIAVAEILAQPGATVLHGELSVAAVTSHEVCEWFLNPHCNLTADSGRGFAVAHEACDPVEDDSYAVTIDHHRVSVSNFVLPAWFDPNAAAGLRYDFLGRTERPFAMTRGGYYVEIDERGSRQVYGDDFPEWKKRRKRRPGGRGARYLTRAERAQPL